MTSAPAKTPPDGLRRAATLAAFAAAVGMMTGPGVVILRTFPFLLKPISEEFHWGRATFSLVLTVASVTSSVLFPLTGRLVDRFGPRAVAVPGMLMLAAVTMSLSLMSGSKAQLVFQFFLLGLAGVASNLIAFSKVVASWFSKRRGLALSLLIGGAPSLAGFFMSWFAEWTINETGWRTSWVIFGIVPLLGIPVLCLWLKERPAPAAGRAETPEASAAPGATVKEALRSRNFWLLVSGLLLTGMVSQGMSQHLVAMLTDGGVKPLVATSAAAVGPLALLLGQVVMGFSVDRVPSPKVAVPFFVISALGLFLLTHTREPLLLNVSSFLFNLGTGAETSFGAYVLTRYFGLRNFSGIYGCVILWTSLCTGMGPSIYGISYDHFGSYQFITTVSIVALSVGGVLVLLLGRYTYAPDLLQAGAGSAATPAAPATPVANGRAREQSAPS